MMGVPPSELGRLSWQEYQAMLWNWNARHNPEAAEDDADAPDPAFVARRHARLAERGIARMPE